MNDKNGLIAFPTSATNLVTLAGWSTGFAGIRARCGVRDKVCVTWTLCALAGARVYVMSRRARHTSRTGWLSAEGTSPTPRGHPVHGVTHRDGVDSRHIIDYPTYLQERDKQVQKRYRMNYSDDPSVCAAKKGLWSKEVYTETKQLFPEALTPATTHEWNTTYNICTLSKMKFCPQ